MYLLAEGDFRMYLCVYFAGIANITDYLQSRFKYYLFPSYFPRGGGKSGTAGIEPCTMRSEMFIFVMLNHRIGAYKCIFVSFSRTECKTEKLE